MLLLLSHPNYFHIQPLADVSKDEKQDLPRRVVYFCVKGKKANLLHPEPRDIEVTAVGGLKRRLLLRCQALK